MSDFYQVKNLNSGYGKMKILEDVSFNIDKGEKCVLIGANGAGKTTLLKTLLGILPTWSGNVFLEQEELTQLKTELRIQKGISYLSEFGVVPNLTIEENFKLGGFFLGKSELKEKIEFMYEKFPDLRQKKKVSAGSLSGGQRKMLALARALISQPKLVMMDEPSAGLSPKFVNEVIDVVQQFHHEFGVACLIAEQNVEFLDLADKVCVIDSGKIIFQGNVEDLKENDIIRKAYFGID